MNGLRVVKGGPWASIQDLGRPGAQRYGLSESGAMDPVSLRIANRLVANPDGAAALEVGVLGIEFVVEADEVTISVVGPDVVWRIDNEVARPNRSHTLARGAIVAVRPGRGAAYVYIGVHRGIDVPSVFGSASFHARSGVGGLNGRALQEGDVIPVHPARVLELELDQPLPHGSGVDEIAVIKGPQIDHFSSAMWNTFVSTPYQVSTKSDRMGIRLEGPAISHTDKGYNIVSDGIALGSIQVPGNGQPIVLGADRQTTGGYPKIVVIARADMFRFSQRPPGSTVRFRSISVEEGADALRRLHLSLERMTFRSADAKFTSERLLGLNLIDGGVWE